MDKSRLAQLMLDWEEQQRQADQLRGLIEQEILSLGATIEVGNVRATYNSPRKSYDYQAAAHDATAEQVAQYTTTSTTVAWRDLVLKELKIQQEDVPFSEGSASVSLKLTGGLI